MTTDVSWAWILAPGVRTVLSGSRGVGTAVRSLMSLPRICQPVVGARLIQLKYEAAFKVMPARPVPRRA